MRADGAGRGTAHQATTPTAALTYGAYLRLPQLLGQQVPRTAAYDEQLFITVHQVHELWFKQLLVELTDARDRMLAGDSATAVRRLRRCREIERALLSALELLDTMAPHDFQAFRGALGSASGAQSAQFHEVEAVSAGRGRTRAMGWLTDAERARLDRRLLEPTLWDGFLAVLTGIPRAGRAAALRGEGPYGELAHALLGHDEGWALWRDRHVLVVERQIGGGRGTAGSSGAAYLRVRSAERFFPELWEARGAVL
ncbi:tryptophan 2,3-dioxygenase family protein [Streptomyces fuscichromogenes]|uniref:Tryptophan 2,3-dioxygenase n=1 Tax=Streptomyces fuscichromogenes TaxID=1324013 RepID=A0A918CQD4_9ACTN|nr:tryptophan 2,3-dioxygenase family protein [Streptomyces fuscichromogenes]GGN04150.1 tryptophan 2,3-dioxygenase [Streptomyces fuscichromogenes]